PSITSHQMCQIRENPLMTAKNAVTKPVGLLRGISMAVYSGSGVTSSPLAMACCLTDQYGSSLVTMGSTAKLYIGGGDVVDHSSERPSQGSPVRSRRCARPRMETHSCATCSAMPHRMMRTPTSATSIQGYHSGRS